MSVVCMSVIVLWKHCTWRGSSIEYGIQLWVCAFEDQYYIAIRVRPENCSVILSLQHVREHPLGIRLSSWYENSSAGENKFTCLPIHFGFLLQDTTNKIAKETDKYFSHLVKHKGHADISEIPQGILLASTQWLLPQFCSQPALIHPWVREYLQWQR